MTPFLIIGVIVLIGLVVYFSSTKTTEDFILTDEFKDILNILNNTNDSVFISGKAGTGKSTLLKYFTSRANKKHVILAPTGVAAEQQ